MDRRPWSGGFRSLNEEHDGPVDDVDGTVPAWLRGTLFRNGSGRNDLGGKWFPHWFDGDGMIQAIRFDAGRIRYTNRFVRTQNYLDETHAGRIKHRGFGKMRPLGVLGNAFRPPANVSNISVLMQGGRLLSLWEGGPPYAIDPSTLETLGIEEFDGQVKAFSAHPKVDPRTGEVFNFGIDYGPATTLTVYRLDKSGLQRFAPVILPYAVMNHDFALTERYLVFCLGPILVHPVRMMLGLTSFDGALRWEGTQPTRILVVARDGKSPPRWTETDPFFQFHFANAYEEDGMLAVDLVRYPDFAVIGEALRTYWRSDWPAAGMGRLTRYRIEPVGGRIEKRFYDTGSSNEFPCIDPRRVGRRYRYAYIANNPADRQQGLQQLLTRVDLDGDDVVSHDFGPNGYPGEPLFVPRSADGAEDDGIVVTLVYDSATERTSIVGLDAANLAARPLFAAHLEHHVPFSLHGTFAAGIL
jgi:all-trans-8'-apo-beta-carotenal 15,15'-oxygenase